MSCIQSPRATIYGTTQITTTTTYFTTYTQLVPQSPVQTTNNVNQPVMVTPTSTITTSSQVVGPTVITQIVPQKTLFHPCRDGEGNGDETGTLDPVFSSATPTMQGGTQFSGAVSISPTPTPSSSATSEPSSNATSSTSNLQSSVKPAESGQSHSSLPTPTGNTQLSTPFQSSSQLHPSETSSDPSGTLAPSRNGTSTQSNTPLIAGVAAGAGVAILLFLLLICLWRRKRRASRRDMEDDNYVGAGNTGDDYWERRFRELEHDGPNEKDFEDDSAEARRIRLTLDLKSKNMSMTPSATSRWSMLSAFFAKTPLVSTRAQPEAFRGDRNSGEELNFSRPIRPYAEGSGIDNGWKAHPIPVMSPARKSFKERSIGRNSLTAWIPKINVSSGAVDKTDSKSDKSTRPAGEWERNQSISRSQSRSRVSYTEKTSSDSESTMSSEDSPLEPPVLPALAHLSEGRIDNRRDSQLTAATFGKNSHRNSAGEEPVARNPSPPIALPPPIHVSAMQGSPLSTASPRSTTNRNSTLSSGKSPKSRQFRSSRPGSRVHRTSRPVSKIPQKQSSLAPYPQPRSESSKRGRPPTLHLSRDAITPSLWVDDEMLARFEAGEETGEVSVFSPDSTTTSAYGGMEDDPSPIPNSDGSRSQRPLSAFTSGSNRSSISVGSALDAPMARIGMAERSAVTPQLPVFTSINSPILDKNWDHGAMERLD